MCSGLLEPRMGANLVKSARHFHARQLAALEQRLIDGRQIERFVGWLLGERCPAEGAEAIVDVLHQGRRRLFVVLKDAAVLEADVAAIPTIVVTAYRHQPA